MIQPGFVVTSQPGHGVQVYESPSGVTVRTMRPEDCAFASRVTVNGFRGKFEHAAGARNMDTVLAATEEEHRLMASKYHHIFIAEYGGQPAGLVQLGFHGDKQDEHSELWNRMDCRALIGLGCLDLVVTDNTKPGYCYVDHICVDEGYRGRGIGQALLVVADQLAVQERCHTIYLWVASDNRALNLYLRQGYVVTKTTRSCGCAKCITGISSFKRMDKRLTP